MNKEELKPPFYSNILQFQEAYNAGYYQAIAENEQWNEYPKCKPDHLLNCWVTINGRNESIQMVYSKDDEFGFANNFITAWMPVIIPSPYNPERREG